MSVHQQIDQNIEAVRDLERRLDRDLDPAALRFQVLAAQLGQPSFLRAVLVFIALWLIVNLCLPVFKLFGHSIRFRSLRFRVCCAARRW